MSASWLRCFWSRVATKLGAREKVSEILAQKLPMQKKAIHEGIHNHIAFSGGITNVLSGGGSSGHGTNTAGIVFGDGTGNST